MNPTPEPKKQACDNCRRRKLKCNRLHPCDQCQKALLYCPYTDVLRRKGPKFRHYYPRPSSSPVFDESHSPSSTAFPTTPRSEASGDLDPRSVGSSAAPMTGSTTSAVGLEGIGLSVSPPGPDDPSCASVPSARRVSSVVLVAHVNVYLKYLYPIMPVPNSAQVLEDADQVNRLSARRYAFLVSLCAATHLQLKLDGHDISQNANDITESTADYKPDPSPSGDTLLAEAVQARSRYDNVGQPSLDSLLTTYFLFVCYNNLNKADHAWFYLSQAVSMVYILRLNRESSYNGLAPQEAEAKRLIFWLLFVTERVYALQQSKPVALRNSINKPDVYGAENPIWTYGLLHSISLLEILPVALYERICSEDEQGNSPQVTLTGDIQSALSTPISLEGVIETQQVDIHITQQWLQVMLWKLGLEASVDQLIRDRAFSHLNVPLTAAKRVTETVSSVSQPSIDVHGIGMEQKLFDVGSCVAQIVRALLSLPHSSGPSFVVDPKELLWGILSSLSNVRGGQSHLFPVLLESTGDILNIQPPSIVGAAGPVSGAEEQHHHHHHHHHRSVPFSLEPWPGQDTKPETQPWRSWASTTPATSVPNYTSW